MSMFMGELGFGRAFAVLKKARRLVAAGLDDGGGRIDADQCGASTASDSAATGSETCHGPHDQCCAFSADLRGRGDRREGFVWLYGPVHLDDALKISAYFEGEAKPGREPRILVPATLVRLGLDD